MQSVKGRLSEKRRKGWKRMLLILLGALLLFPALLLRVWLSSRTVELAYDIGRLQTENRALEEENRKLLLEIARLKSPERISRIAITDLKMIRSSEAEVISILP